MNRIIAILFFCSFSIISFSQDFTSAKDSDPQAKSILDKVKKKYDGYQSLEAKFTLDIEIPEQPKEVQKGTIAQQGEKYNMELGTYGAISDGNTIWLMMHNNKEVQVNNIPEEGEDDSILSPQSLLTFYEKDEYIYILANEYHDKTLQKNIQQIEFKPTDRDSEYTKLRLTVEKGTHEVQRVEAFSRDGSRYTFTLNQVTPNKTFAASHFTFNKSKYPDYYVEDLR